MPPGWIKLHRSIVDWEWYSDINVSRLFTHLLVTANYEEKKWQGQTIKRGQIVTSIGNLSDQTGLTNMQVRTALKKLKSTSEVTSKTTNKFTVLTIENYSLYQKKDDDVTSKATGKTTNKQQTDNNQITTTKEVKKLRSKEVNNYIYKKIDLSELPECVSMENAKLLIDYRQKMGKKFELVQSSFDLLIKKSQKPNSIGMSPDQVILECVTEGWQGINVQYLENKHRGNHAPNRPSKNPRASLQETAIQNAREMDAYIASVAASEQTVGANEPDVRLQVAAEGRRPL